MDARVMSYESASLVRIADPRPSREAAETAGRTLIRWAGDDPTRDGLLDTPARVVRACEEWFRGYSQDAGAILDRTFPETGGYRDMVLHAQWQGRHPRRRL
jgi:GTP cyclohydrolase I